MAKTIKVYADGRVELHLDDRSARAYAGTSSVILKEEDAQKYLSGNQLYFVHEEGKVKLRYFASILDLEDRKARNYLKDRGFGLDLQSTEK